MKGLRQNHGPSSGKDSAGPRRAPRRIAKSAGRSDPTIWRGSTADRKKELTLITSLKRYVDPETAGDPWSDEKSVGSRPRALSKKLEHRASPTSRTANAARPGLGSCGLVDSWTLQLPPSDRNARACPRVYALAKKSNTAIGRSIIQRRARSRKQLSIIESSARRALRARDRTYQAIAAWALAIPHSKFNTSVMTNALIGSRNAWPAWTGLSVATICPG
jgi:hypothetical protein